MLKVDSSVWINDYSLGDFAFYAYTKDRIFFMGFENSKGPDYYISSLPRNPRKGYDAVNAVVFQDLPLL